MNEKETLNKAADILIDELISVETSPLIKNLRRLASQYEDKIEPVAWKYNIGDLVELDDGIRLRVSRRITDDHEKPSYDLHCKGFKVLNYVPEEALTPVTSPPVPLRPK